MKLRSRNSFRTAAVAVLAVMIAAGAPIPGQAEGPAPEQPIVADVAALVPVVQSWEPGQGSFHLAKDARLALHADLPPAITEAFATDLRLLTDRALPSTAEVASGDVAIVVDPSLPAGPTATAGDSAEETYRMVITDRVTITGRTPAAAARGMQTLLQLFSDAPGRRDLPQGTINDWPRAGDRIIMLDAGRHYYQVAYIKQLIREMAWLKFDTLHLHLTEWNGFRLDSPNFPGLAPEESYDQGDIAALEEEAARYGIEILPEIDLPAHATAITTMWPELNWECASMGTMFGIGSFTMNVTKRETFERTKELLDEFIPWFSGPRFHVGTDEYPTNAAQKACRELVEFAAAEGYGDTADAFVHFINAMNDTVRTHGKETVVWDWWRYQQSPTIDIDKDITVQAWTNDGQQFLADGYEVIVSPASRFYVTPWTSPGLNALQPSTQWFTNGLVPSAEAGVVGYALPRWSDQAETENDSYFEWFAHRPEHVLADRAWGAPSDDTAAEIEDRLDRLGPPPGEPWRTQPDAEAVTGVAFASGPPWDAAGVPAHAFDGNVTTAVDLDEDAGHVGLDLGEGNATTINGIRFYPRSGHGLTRMVGGKFQGCTEGPDAGCRDLASVDWKPPLDWMHLTVADATPYRWLRYVAPAGGHGNVAEIQFLTSPEQSPLAVALSVPPTTKALGHTVGSNTVTVTLTNTGTKPVTSPKLRVLAVGEDFFTRTEIPFRLPRSAILPGQEVELEAQLPVSLATQGERIRVQAIATAQAAGTERLTVARATAGTTTLSPVQVTVSPELAVASDGTAEVSVTLTNSAAADVEVTLVATPGDGVTVTPESSTVRVQAGGTSAVAFSVSAPDVPGTTSIPMAVTVSGAGQTAELADAQLRISVPYPSLEAALDVVAFTDDDNPNPEGLGGGVDGDGSSYSWQALADAGVQPGGTFQHGGFDFVWPDRDGYQAVLADGQLISVGASASAIGFLTAGEWGPVSGTGVVTYTDGTTSEFTISDPDWQTWNVPPDAEVAIQMPYHNYAYADRINRNTYVFFHEVATDPSKTIQMVQLPGWDQGGRFHIAVFSMALR
ncbi:beta-N-acetylhexosaminidase [Tessaracoccus sp. OS52]|uniref:family 20 glycosylhydrolase n=1 Tax=Tessaracoccus sp. OS52 TaxID=2886691 RepID=UPI001D110D01|nr:family 20 glycosylhydrolase [Tessaracoccus sp. OS52]MCC2593746.1 beta-N-acetylhexosaminidase [Tessaracoccus sp. OS52]